MKRAIFLATSALLAMLILVPITLAQEETTLLSSPLPSTFITALAAGGGGNDWLSGGSGEQRDKLYCGKGKDTYFAEKIDYVDSSCEKKEVGGSA